MRTINFRTKIKNLSSSINTDGREFKSAVKFLKVFALNWICEMNGCSMSKLNGDLVAISFLISYCVNNNIELDNVFADPDAISDSYFSPDIRSPQSSRKCINTSSKNISHLVYSKDKTLHCVYKNTVLHSGGASQTPN